MADDDAVWTSSRTARQIRHALEHVENDLSRLLAVAASSISLLTLPQTDDPAGGLPHGEERSEQFVLEVSEYFERLDSIQGHLKDLLAHIKSARIAPSAINAPPPGFVPPSFGTTASADSGTSLDSNRGFQEERVERDAWKGILDALERMQKKRESLTNGHENQAEPASEQMEE